MDEPPAAPEPLPVTPVRGMRDLLPDECALRDAATATILDVYRRHGFQRIETPVLEHLSLLASGQGGENEKLIFKVLRRGEDLQRALAGARPGSEPDPDALADSGLRFDLTVPLARYFAAQRGKLPLPFRAIQLGPVFRAERPQKGRFRQFTQCDIDVLGEAGPVAEVELIVATVEALAELGLSDLTVRLNDRRLLRALALAAGVADEARQDALFVTLDKLDRSGAEGVRAELVARGFPAATVEQVSALVLAPAAAAEAAPDPVGWARAVGAERLAADLAVILDAVGGVVAGRARVVFDATLVRGMGYYTGPIFEIGLPGVPHSIAGGGRYDRMIGRICGQDVPAAGFSIGFERVVALLAGAGWRPAADRVRLALLWDPETDTLDRVAAEADQLRRQGNAVTLLRRQRRAGRQLHELREAGFDGAVSLPAGHRAPEIEWFTRP